MSTPLPQSPVPLFPLPGAFLYPAQVLPLHVFEPRYRQLVEDSLDGPGRLVIGTIVGDDDPPGVLPVAGLGEIVRHEKLTDGRFHLWVLGLARVRIDETPSDRMYRRVQCSPFAEVQADPAEAGRLKSRLRAAAQSRLAQKLPLPAAAPTGVLTDLLLQILQLPQALTEDIFAETSVAERARKALDAHARFPHSPQRSTDTGGDSTHGTHDDEVPDHLPDDFDE
ncbi:MAG: LON peptidase substrate-binding domain-containing protein [Planctomycetota bacterium]